MDSSYIIGEITLITRILKNIISGIINGVLFYLIFIVILPLIVFRLTNMSITPVNPLVAVYILGFFLALGVISSSVKPFIGIVFDVILSLIGLLFTLSIVSSGEYGTVINLYGYSVEVVFDFKPLLLVVIGFGILFVILNMFSRIVKPED